MMMMTTESLFAFSLSPCVLLVTQLTRYKRKDGCSIGPGKQLTGEDNCNVLHPTLVASFGVFFYSLSLSLSLCFCIDCHREA